MAASRWPVRRQPPLPHAHASRDIRPASPNRQSPGHDRRAGALRLLPARGRRRHRRRRHPESRLDVRPGARPVGAPLRRAGGGLAAMPATGTRPRPARPAAGLHRRRRGRQPDPLESRRRRTGQGALPPAARAPRPHDPGTGGRDALLHAVDGRGDRRRRGRVRRDCPAAGVRMALLWPAAVHPRDPGGRHALAHLAPRACGQRGARLARTARCGVGAPRTRGGARP